MLSAGAVHLTERVWHGRGDYAATHLTGRWELLVCAILLAFTVQSVIVYAISYEITRNNSIKVIRVTTEINYRYYSNGTLGMCSLTFH